jgi:integrase
LEDTVAAEYSRFSLFKRSNGVYAILYYHHGHRHWKSTGVSTKPEALEALTHFKDLLTGDRPSLLLSEFIARFLSYAETTYSPATQDLYRRTFGRLQAITGRIYLAELTPEHFDRYKSQQLRSVSPVTVNIELRALRAALNTARRWKLVEANPFAEVKFVQVPDVEPVFFTIQQFQKFVGLIKEDWFRDVVLFAVLTGLREGEILNLQWSNVDLPRQMVNIQTSATFKTKQGRRRRIPLNEAAIALLRSRQGRSASEYVFTLNDKPIFNGWVQHLFKRYIRQADLPLKLHFHSLRHTFASWLVQGGATLYEVQRLLGHSSPRVTEVYSHLQPEHLHETVNRIVLSLN